ncbi:RNA-splicing ligase RtcB-like isoform X1 [Montipora capricornis]|uniref:RNA-splicing ligase RtcB-like isoform X1 n=1 Tax=Montipora capricornis TaxID=246305 RepID=UPI0035F15F8C
MFRGGVVSNRSSSFVVLGDAKNKGAPVKAWVKGVPVEKDATDQLLSLAKLPIVHSHVAAMPDMHLGKGACVGCVVATVDAIIPSAVGVDIGCGMMAVRTTLSAKDLPDSLKNLRVEIERAVPHGRTNQGGKGDLGAWKANNLPKHVVTEWEKLKKEYEYICSRQPMAKAQNNVNHLGTLGTGNHFIEACLDEEDRLWFMLHSGSRGPGNRIGTVYIELAKNDMMKLDKRVKVDKDLAYLQEGTKNFDDYVFAVNWAQKFARLNRDIMMSSVIMAARACPDMPTFDLDPKSKAVNCHHNYVNVENHFGKEVFLTRKGAVSARDGELGIIPGSMGARSYIVKGKGNPESFHSCSHGAGRTMSRAKAKKLFTVEDHVRATQGVECRKDAGVIDETPMAYKDIDDVMAAQTDLVDVVHRLKQVLCVKG